MITILLVDDQNLVQQGIKSLLEQEMELKVIGTVKDGKSALEEITRTKPDIVLLDIEMPGMNGITTTKYINRISPETKVIILSSHEDKKYVTQALLAGAKGYLLKSSLMTDLKQAIIAVCNGYSQIDSRLLAKVFDPNNFKQKTTKTTSSSTRTPKKVSRDTRQNISPTPVSPNRQSTSKASDTVTSFPKAIANTEESVTKVITDLEVDNATTSDSCQSINPPDSELPQTATIDAEASQVNVLAQEEISVSLPDAQDSVEVQSLPSVITYPNKFDYYSRGKGTSNLARKPLITSLTNKTVRQKSVLQLRQLSQTVKSQLRLIQNYLAKQAQSSWATEIRAQLLKLKNQLHLLVKQRQQRDLLWNIGLICLGIMIVIILGNL